MRRAVVAVAGGLLLAGVTTGCGSSGSAGSAPAAAKSAAAALESAGAALQSAAADAPGGSDFGLTEAPGDAKITSCAADKDGNANAVLEVTNNGAKASKYLITVTFTTGTGHLIGAGTATVPTLDPGRTTTDNANSGMTAGGEAFTCNLGTVTRYNLG